ncbi:MAG: hypothetical protein ICV69_08425 [Thermoleophilaceae bacterium]|nr:hypothetical protein [Thermoleophilaceae bacterium]
MTCRHEGFHGIRTNYDRAGEVLVFNWTCERCGATLGEVRRERYRPRFERRVNGRQGAVVR